MFSTAPSHERLDTRCRLLLHAEGREGADNNSFSVSGMEDRLLGVSGVVAAAVCAMISTQDEWKSQAVTIPAWLGCGEPPEPSAKGLR